MLFTIAAVATLALGQQTDTTVSVRSGMRLDVSNFGGGIVVHGWSQNSVRVQASHSSRDHVDVVIEGSTVSVKAEGRRGMPQTVDYEISAPAWMELNLHGTYTDIEVDGTQGSVTAETVNGEVKVRGGSGHVTLKSVQGAVSLENAKGHIDLGSVNEDITVRNVSGDIAVETVSGSVTLEGVDAASVEVSTTNGDVQYDGTIKDGGRYSFSTNNGDVSISVPERANATVTVSTFNGDFDSSFPVSVTSTSKHRFSFTIGSGSARLELETFNGDIKLHRPGQVQGKHHEREDN